MSKILIIDDETQIRRVLARFLALKGYEPLEAENGQAALRVMSSAGPQAALLDMHIPGTDSLELLKKLFEMNEKLVVFLISGSQEDEKIRQALALGAAGYIMKPFDFSELLSMVTAKLKQV